MVIDNYNGSINGTSSESKEIFTRNVIMMKTFKFWRQLNVFECRMNQLEIETNGIRING